MDDLGVPPFQETSIAGHFHGKNDDKWMKGHHICGFMWVELGWNQQNWDSHADN